MQGAVEGYVHSVKEGTNEFSWDTLWGIALSDRLLHTPNAMSRAWASIMVEHFDSAHVTWESLKDFLDPKAIERANRHLDEGRPQLVHPIIQQAIDDALARKQQAIAEAERSVRVRAADEQEAKYQAEKRARRNAGGAEAGRGEGHGVVDDARLRPMRGKKDADDDIVLKVGKRK